MSNSISRLIYSLTSNLADFPHPLTMSKHWETGKQQSIDRACGSSLSLNYKISGFLCSSLLYTATKTIYPCMYLINMENEIFNFNFVIAILKSKLASEILCSEWSISCLYRFNWPECEKKKEEWSIRSEDAKVVIGNNDKRKWRRVLVTTPYVSLIFLNIHYLLSLFLSLFHFATYKVTRGSTGSSGDDVR